MLQTCLWTETLHLKSHLQYAITTTYNHISEAPTSPTSVVFFNRKASGKRGKLHKPPDWSGLKEKSPMGT